MITTLHTFCKLLVCTVCIVWRNSYCGWLDLKEKKKCQKKKAWHFLFISDLANNDNSLVKYNHTNSQNAEIDTSVGKKRDESWWRWLEITTNRWDVEIKSWTWKGLLAWWREEKKRIKWSGTVLSVATHLNLALLPSVNLYFKMRGGRSHF